MKGAPGAIRIALTPTIANEYMTRSVFQGEDEGPAVEWSTKPQWLPVSTVQAMLADAGFNGDSKSGPDEIPLSIGNAYRALAKKCRKLLENQPCHSI